MTCRARSDAPKSDIEPYEQLLFDENEEHDVLWSMYFNIPSCCQCSDAVKLPTNTYVACGPYFELDYDESIRAAKKLFTQIYGMDDEFLPRAPDPEEIIIEGDNPTDPPAWIVADLSDLNTDLSNAQANAQANEPATIDESQISNTDIKQTELQ